MTTNHDIARLHDVPVFVVLHDIFHWRGGLTLGALERAMLYAERLGRPTTVLTFAFDPDIDHSMARLRERGFIDDRLVIRNLFEDAGLHGRPMTPFFDGSTQSDSLSDVHECEICSPGAPEGPTSETRDVDGQLIVTRTSPEGVARFREFFDLQGRLRRSECLDGATGAVLHRRLFDVAGRARVEFLPRASGEDRWPTVFTDESDAVVRSFASQLEMRAQWLDSFARQSGESVFLVESEWPLVVRTVREMTAPGVAKAYMMHSSHLDYPHTLGSPTMPTHAAIFTWLDDFDAFALITEEHLRDVAAEFGERSILCAVPHQAPPALGSMPTDKDPLLVVGVGRFVPRKNWDQVIAAFAQVVKSVPEARFELWGLGPLEEAYRQQISELGLEQSVSLMGRTENTAEVFRTAGLSVLAGIREAFGRVILESMAQGTPVVSYDGKYGARDIIRDGVDGLLVSYGDTEGLARAMIALLSDPKRTARMGRAALKVDRRFSPELCTDRWIALFARALEQRDRRVTLPRMKAQVDEMARLRAGRILDRFRGYRLAGQLELAGLAELPEVKLLVRSRDGIVGAHGLSVKLGASDGSGVRFSARVDASVLASVDGPWDAYLSVHLRNAHRFVRLGCAEGLVVPRQVPATAYATRHGNLSFKPRSPGGTAG